MFLAIKHIYRFGDFRLDATNRLLLRQTETVPIPPKVFDLLLVLVERPGQVVEKDELMRLLWPDTFVEDNNLTVSMSALRKVLGEGKDGAKFIETIPRRGYRFVAPLIEQAETPPLKKAEVELFAALESAKPANPLPPTPPPTFPARSNHRKVLEAGFWTNRNFWAVIGLLALALMVGGWWWLKPAIFTSGAIRSIAVLPLKPLNAGAHDDLLSLGLADSLITRLSNTGKIVVRPTSAIAKYSRPDQDSLAAGRELEVDAVLEGRVLRIGDQIRITVQLLKLPNGHVVSGWEFDEKFTNLLSLQKQISEKVALGLTLKLSESEQQLLTKNYTDNQAAFEAYLKGRYFWNKRTQESLLKAIEFFQQAIALDPNYALAYAGIADSYTALGIPQVVLTGQRNGSEQNQARLAAEKAVSLDPNLAEAHAALGAAIADKDDAAAHREFERAIQLNPNYSSVYSFYGFDKLGDGEPEEALKYMAKAKELDPISVPINSNYGMALARLRRANEGIEQFRKTLELDPNHLRAHWGLGLCYEQLGRYDEAIAEYQQALKFSNDGLLAIASLGRAYAVTGRRAEAQQMLEKMLERERAGDRHPYYLAALYIALGDKDAAFDVLEKNRGRYSLGLMKYDHFFDSIRSDARYAGLFK